MEAKYKLTVTVLTMNRAEQLQNAIKSCLNSDLPEETQFVIVDNASTDDTEAVVEAMKADFPYDLVYRKEEVNRGVGGGRNVCFDLAEGEHVYFLDDDAEIPEECYKTFFMSSIEYLDKNPSVATLTTNIHDEVFGEREVAPSSLVIDGLTCVYTFQGGTVFVRKACFKSPMFMNIMYGNEEIPISMDVLDKGFYNVYKPDIYINHYPKVNKWVKDKDRINVQGASNIYMFKKMQYPIICKPVLYMAYVLRLYRYQLQDKSLVKEFKMKRKDFCRNNKLEKIKIKTIIKSFKNFGMTTF